MNIKKDLYELLGVEKGAEQDQIKKAYRKLARKHHPDVNPGDKQSEEKFKEIGMAYEILSDPEKRQRYDQFGAAAFQPGMGQPGDFDPSSAGFGDLSDIFEMFFGERQGRGSRRQDPARGADIQAVVDLTLLEVVKGTKKTITIERSIPCSYCNGSGAKPGSHPETCPTCNGRGQVVTGGGMLRFSQTCPNCHGSGQINKNPCDKCGGTGRQRQLEKIAVKIPPGVTNNSRIRVSGKGNAGNMGAPAGDLYVYTRVYEHSFFQRVEDNLYCIIPITFAEAALGASIEVPTLTGKGRLRIIPGTQSGQQIRIRGKGIPHLRGWGQGDQICEVVVKTPSELSTKEKELLKKLEKESRHDIRSDLNI
ncbi:molecular chaperone DnaJ [bacterium]|nr:molecular chaperone DnaJ [bacterium]